MINYKKGKYSTCTFTNDEIDIEKNLYPFRIDVSFYGLPNLLRLFGVGIGFNDVKGKWKRVFKYKSNKLTQIYNKTDEESGKTITVKKIDYIPACIIDELMHKIMDVINSDDYITTIEKKIQADYNRSQTQKFKKQNKEKNND